MVIRVYMVSVIIKVGSVVRVFRRKIFVWRILSMFYLVMVVIGKLFEIFKNRFLEIFFFLIFN